MPALAAVTEFQPTEIINMNEAPPPWEARPDALANSESEMPAEPAELAGTAPLPVEPAEVPAGAAPTTDDFTPAVERAGVAAPASSASSMESWYRNRRQRTAKPSAPIGEVREAAKRGDAAAQYKLGMYFRTDEGGQDIKQSIDWQRKAAQGGYAEAQYGLGLLYANGQYVSQDAGQARNWFQKAADQGHVAANLALLSLADTAPPAIAQAPLALEDNQPAVEAAQDKPAQPEPVQFTVAEAALPKLEPKTPPTVTAAVPEVAAAAPAIEVVAPAPEPVIVAAPAPTEGAAGNPGPSSNLDLTGVETSVLRQSAEAGDKQAQLMLGTMYEDGVGGLPSDMREAAYWYEQAARQGFTKAQYNLGLLYEDGRGVKQDYKQAAYWYDKAAKAGFTEAQNNLGVLFILGKGVKVDKKKAEALFSDAASNGNPNAQRNLDMLRNG